MFSFLGEGFEQASYYEKHCCYETAICVFLCLQRDKNLYVCHFLQIYKIWS